MVTYDERFRIINQGGATVNGNPASISGAVVHGLEDVETWDAIAVTRWAKFQRGVLEILDDMDYRFLWHLAVNVMEARQSANFEFYRRLSA